MWSAAILGGGRARRFGGRDKRSLIVDGRVMLDRQLTALRSVADEILLVGGDGAPGSAGVKYTDDRIPGCGPLGGLHAALSETAGDATIVVACDMPFLSASLLRHLLELTREADAVVPRTEGGYHPLCAAYTRACLDPIRRRLADKRLKMTDLLDEVRVRIVGTDEIGAFGDARRMLANVNTPDELASLDALKNHEL